VAGVIADGGLVAVPGGWVLDVLGVDIGLSISGRGGDCCYAFVAGNGGIVGKLAAGRALAVGRVLAAGRVTRLRLGDLLCSPLAALLNTAVRSSHPRV